MPLRIFFNIFLIFPLLLLPKYVHSLTVQEKCGQFLLGVEVTLDSNEGYLHHKLYYIDSALKKHVFYRSEAGSILHAGCTHNTKNEPLLLFQESCGGNGCPEEVFGLYSLNKKKLLLNPRDWPNGNLNKVEKILGTPLLGFNKRNNFCCARETRKLISAYLKQ